MDLDLGEVEPLASGEAGVVALDDGLVIVATVGAQVMITFVQFTEEGPVSSWSLFDLEGAEEFCKKLQAGLEILSLEEQFSLPTSEEET